MYRNMIAHKGLVGVLDGYFPWGSIQCFVKGSSFSFGQALGHNLLAPYFSPFTAEVLSGGVGGGVQGKYSADSFSLYITIYEHFHFFY